ncbi:MAG: hypothetical protein OXC53_00400 [Rhodobacteraceae bacterium]|nr:hypothetical protein [Paracoccaceae bacterium]
MVILARRSKSRTTAFSREIPTDWRPSQVRNPNDVLDTHFTDASAWELIATMLEKGHLIEEVTLHKPRGATGYVMQIDLDPRQAQLYVKLQLGSGKIIGCSFHYSEWND